MTWVQLDDLYPEHPKVVNAGPLAKALYVDALCYASRYLTDGRISKQIARRLARDYADYADPDSLIQALLSVGLWTLDGDDVLISSNRLWSLRGELRPVASVWASLRRMVFARDDYTCQYCGDRGNRLECDHVVPVSRGGPNHLDNLVAACRQCNRSKGAKLVEEWL